MHASHLHPTRNASTRSFTPSPLALHYTSDDLGCDDLHIWQHSSTPTEKPDLSTDFLANLGQNQTPLQLAIMNGNESMARFLLERGADITLRDRIGSTVLHSAAESGDETVIKLALEKSADPNQTDYAGRSALFIAVQKGDEAVAKPLLDTSVDMTLKDMWDRTALHVAVEMDSVAMAALLLTYGANIDL